MLLYFTMTGYLVKKRLEMAQTVSPTFVKEVKLFVQGFGTRYSLFLVKFGIFITK